MSARNANDGSDLDIPAQIAALRAQLEELVEKGGAAATQAVHDVRRAATGEMDTICAQVRTQPVATAMIALTGAAFGYLLGRMMR